MKELLISKPQFDTDKLKVGEAVYVTRHDHRGVQLKAFWGIIVKSHPLQLEVIYVGTDRLVDEDEECYGKYGTRYTTIDIDEMTAKRAQIRKAAQT